MLELYSSAIDKIRRIDVLKDELRALKGEDGKLSASVIVYRKKNDWREKEGNDGAISKINDRRTAVSKREALVKAEIKSLRAEVYDILSICFVQAKTEEHRAKIREACIYASGGAAMISQTGKTPSAFGKCKIIGCRATHDLALDGEVETIVRAGVKNTSGRFIVLPEVVIYRFDEHAEVGEYSVLNRRYPEDFKQKEPQSVDYSYDSPVKDSAPETVTYDETLPEIDEILIPPAEESPAENATENTADDGKAAKKEKAREKTRSFNVNSRFKGKTSIVALVLAVLWAGFYLAAALSGASAITFGDDIWKYAIAYIAVAVVRTTAVIVSREKYSDGGLFPLFSLYGGALSAFALVWSELPEKSFFLPLAMLLSGIVTLAVTPAGEKDENFVVSAASFAAVGALFAFAIYNMYIAAGGGAAVVSLDNSLEIVVVVTLCAVAVAGLVAAVLSALKKCGKTLACSTAGFSAFCAVSALCFQNGIWAMALAVIIAICGIVRLRTK